MFTLRLILFLFIVGSVNVVIMLLANTLPALQGMHMESVAVAAAFLLIADAVFIYILFFRMPSMDASKRYQEFEKILQDYAGDNEIGSEEFEQAYREWKDEY